MLKVAIIGASGYTGLELLKLLSQHPRVEIECITSRQYKGSRISDIFPSFRRVLDKTFADPEDPDIVSNASLVFTAVPHKRSMEVVPKLIQDGKRVIDLSADFRFKDVKTYEAWYDRHTAPELLKDAVYGLPELYREDIRNGTLIANTGCYATASILGLAPLIKGDLIEPRSIVIDAKSGVSGAGRTPTLETSFVEVNEGFRAYKVGAHRHAPEIEERLSSISGRDIKVTFVPYLLPINRGILSTIYASPKGNITTNSLIECLEKFYKEEPFIRVLPQGTFPNTSHVMGSNFCDIGVKVDKRTERVIVLTAIDNLVKGSSGTAVQNMNIMFGFPEDTGLPTPFYPW